MNDEKIAYIKIGSYGGYNVFRGKYRTTIWEIQSNPTQKITIPNEIFNQWIERLRNIE